MPVLSQPYLSTTAWTTENVKFAEMLEEHESKNKRVRINDDSKRRKSLSG